MNIKIIKYTISQILKIEAAFMLLPCIVSLIYKEDSTKLVSFLITIAVLLVISFILSNKVPDDISMHTKEGFIIVTLSWIFLSIFGALPFVISREIPSFIDAFFETVSGFTTTGASILTDVEGLSNSMQFWRCFTHLVGGMGVLVFALAVLPKSSKYSMHIMKAEVPGPIVGKLVSKTKNTAIILYAIYLIMFLIVFLLLVLAKMPVFDALLHAFGTAGTGGFGIKSNSVAYYNNPNIEMIIGIGMLLFGINFNLYYFLLIGNIKDILKNEEVKLYLTIIAFSTITIAINILDRTHNILTALRYSFFSVSSVITTTGFAVDDFNEWPNYSKIILLILMFIGGCAGSTSGGFKISRVLILIKTFINEIKKSINPNRVLKLKIDNKPLDDKISLGVANYLIVYIFIYIIGVILVSLSTNNIVLSISSVAATFNNIGPGLDAVGPMGNYAELSNFNKVLLSFLMLAGRLEIFPILILFSTNTFKNIIKKK